MLNILLIFVTLSLNGAFSQNDKYFFSYPLKTNWYKAIEACKYKNMELVSVSNQDTLNYIQTYIDDLKFDTNFDTWENSIWTSGNDLGEHGQQTWLSLGKHVSQDFLNNHNKFIDHSIKEAGEIEHCLTMVRKPDKFTFNDEICSAQRFFMCERLFHECDFSIFESYKLAVIRPTTSSTTTSKPVEHNDFSVTPGVIN